MRAVIKTTKTKSDNTIQLIANTDYKRILVIGVFHGDEPQGEFLINEDIKRNSATRLLFIPCLNPDGKALNSRTNSQGVDLNRNFPTKNWELTEKNEFFGGDNPASEIETRVFTEVIDR